MKMFYEAYVDNIGNIGTFDKKHAAIKAIRETIKNSARADDHGFVVDNFDEIVFEVGENADAA